MLDTMAQTTFDAARAEAFGGKLLNILNHGGVSLMISVGHRTGLFDVLRDLPPATSEEIAARAKLNERYVREWLGAMVTGEVIEVDPATRRYHLPAEHAAFLTRAGAPNNVGVVAQFIAVLGAVEDDVVECFRNGGGVPYEKFPRFHDVMAEDSSQSVVSSLESHVLPLVPGLADRLTRGIRVLDLGCGRGRIMIRLAERFPNSRFTGLDLSRVTVAEAQADVQVMGLHNISFTAVDLSDFDEKATPEAFDLITTFDAVHDQARPMNLLKGIYKALAPDGVYLMQDINGSSHVHNNIGNPIAALLYTISCMHCMTVSLAQGGEGLGAMWGEERTREYLERAGFTSIVTRRIAHDIQNNWYVVTK